MGLPLEQGCNEVMVIVVPDSSFFTTVEHPLSLSGQSMGEVMVFVCPSPVIVFVVEQPCGDGFSVSPL